MPARVILSVCLVLSAIFCFAQDQPIDRYIGPADFNEFNAVATTQPGRRDVQKIKGLLPNRKSSRFAEYVTTKFPDKFNAAFASSLLQGVEKLRLNKQVGGPSGSQGVTSLISHVAVPAIVGLGVEYGSILQRTSGNTTTFRANLLGVFRMAFGHQQFPNCAVIDQQHCQPASRWLRRFSAVASFQNVNKTTTTVSATPATTSTPLAVDLTGNGTRMASWGARFDLTTNDPSDPKYVDRWRDAIKTFRGDPRGQELTAAIDRMITANDQTYSTWTEETVGILQSANSGEFKQKLEQQLDLLFDRLLANDPGFVDRVVAVQQASQNYFTARDELLQAIQSHRFSLEYTNQHLLNQPSTSNMRLIYSHQPSRSPTLITANVAVTWYNTLPAAPPVSRLRDVQAAGQLDRRLGDVPNFGNAIATFGAYYQWMKEDALITIGPGNVAPGSGIVLPGTAAQLLGTKGSIGIVQGKLTMPISNTIKVPFSITWSNRTELIKESDTRGQVGITFDLDSLFK